MSRMKWDRERGGSGAGYHIERIPSKYLKPERVYKSVEPYRLPPANIWNTSIPNEVKKKIDEARKEELKKKEERKKARAKRRAEKRKQENKNKMISSDKGKAQRKLTRKEKARILMEFLEKNPFPKK